MTSVHKRIAATALSAALLLPATSAFGNDWTKHFSRLRGTTIGATAGALIAGPPGAVLGGAVGNGVQHARHMSHRHHYRHHRR